MIEPPNKAAKILLRYAAMKKRSDLLGRLGMSESTFMDRIRHPKSFKISELLIMQSCLGISDEDLLQVIKLSGSAR